LRYLVKTSEKEKILRWVIETLADAKNDFIKETDSQGKFPLTRFLNYYIVGRDAVVCDTLCLGLDSIIFRVLRVFRG
jgi:hypothetical protein